MSKYKVKLINAEQKSDYLKRNGIYDFYCLVYVEGREEVYMAYGHSCLPKRIRVSFRDKKMKWADVYWGARHKGACRAVYRRIRKLNIEPKRLKRMPVNMYDEIVHGIKA